MCVCVCVYRACLILTMLCAEGKMIKGMEDILEPREITKQELQIVHTEEYLESLTVCQSHLYIQNYYSY